MTQQAIIRALQNGSLTAYEMENLTGIPRTSIVAACKKMFRKKELTVEKIKVHRAWVCKYTLLPHMIEATKAVNDEPYDKFNPFDIRNAVGIFTKAEYAVMNSQARRLFNGNPNFTKEITNNQFI
jgi:ribosomal protein S19